jgi:CheY-like chemotaxis protein/HPt (histidine-containing phosphotransfer) domain-containing protein
LNVQAHVPSDARRILIAAEDGISRHIMAGVLGDEGHVLAFADDGAEAVAMVQHQPFDLVLMDVQLPGMDGLQATRQIRGLPGPERSIPILTLSADTTALEEDQRAAAGVTGGLSKPFEWDRIMAAIDRHAPGSTACNATGSECAMAAKLVDPEVLRRLQARAGPDNMHTMVRMAIDAYDLYCEEMVKADAGPVVIAREAHKIRGSAGTLGLRRISTLAGEIEDALRRNLTVDSVVRQLRVAMDQTRDELKRMGALGSETYLVAVASGPPGPAAT